MSDIRTSIFAKFKDTPNDLNTDLDDERLYYGESTQDPTYPYSVFHAPDDAFTFTFQESFDDVLIQFDYYSKDSSPDACDKGLKDIMSLYDWTNLTMTEYIFLKMERTFVMWPKKNQPENVWQGIVRYTLMLQNL